MEQNLCNYFQIIFFNYLFYSPLTLAEFADSELRMRNPGVGEHSKFLVLYTHFSINGYIKPSIKIVEKMKFSSNHSTNIAAKKCNTGAKIEWQFEDELKKVTVHRMEKRKRRKAESTST